MQRARDQPATSSAAERALVLAQPVRQRAVELQPVAVRPHAAVAQQVARVLMREQVLAGRHRAGIELGERGLQREVERVARLLVPEQRIVAQHLGVGDRVLERQAPVGVDRELRLAVELLRARPRCAGGPRRSNCRSSSSRPCSRGRDSCASRRAAARCPCRDSSSRPPRRRRRAGWRRACGARRAGGTTACRRSLRPRPRPPCRSCRPRPSARHARPASRSSSASPRCGSGVEIVAGIVHQRLRIGLHRAAARSARGSARPARSGRCELKP